ncbi:MAG TPA: hypothetical protein VGM76_10910 [Lacipirellulaceae bacterium]
MENDIIRGETIANAQDEVNARAARMPEGEVILRLALHILGLPRALPCVTVCLDRHHVMSNGVNIFSPTDFLSNEGWVQTEQHGKHPWFGSYTKSGHKIIVSPNSHGGDIVATVGRTRVRAECKKGNLQRTKGNPENKLIHEAIGQLMTIEEFDPDDVLLVAVPRSDASRSKFKWQIRPLMQRIGIHLVLVGSRPFKPKCPP